MILIGETIGVMIMAMNLPGDRIPLVKSIQADFVKRSSGSMTGVVKLSDEQIESIQREPKGEIELEVGRKLLYPFQEVRAVEENDCVSDA